MRKKHNERNVTKLYQWYVNPLDDHTNEVFSRELPEENAVRDEMTNQGPKNLWKCSVEQKSLFERSRASKHLDFAIYVREGKYGTPRLWQVPKNVRVIQASKMEPKAKAA